MVANRWVTWLREGQWHHLPPSEDFSGSSTLSKKIHLGTVSLSVAVFLFVLEEHKCDVELLITAYWEFFSMLSFSLKNMLMKITLRLQ